MKKLTLSALIAAIAALSLNGAQAAIATTALSKLPTSASEQDVVATLGKPESITHWGNGTHSLAYDLKDNAQARAYVDVSDATGKVVDREIIRRD